MKFVDPSCDKSNLKGIKKTSQCPKESECESYKSCETCQNVLGNNITDKNDKFENPKDKRSTEYDRKSYMKRSNKMTQVPKLTTIGEYKREKGSRIFAKCLWKNIKRGWSCFAHVNESGSEKASSQEKLDAPFYGSPQTKQESCPLKCSEINECNACLSSNGGGDGPWSQCSWSTELSLCLSPPEISLRCLGGVCGMVLSLEGLEGLNKSDFVHSMCPKPCSSYSQCKTCLERTRCGWCSFAESNGAGKCLEGTIEGPFDTYQCKTTQPSWSNFKRSTIEGTLPENSVNTALGRHLPNKFETSWNFNTCPAENECLNGHHNCEPESEICLDQEHGFKCNCSTGYKRLSKTNKHGQCSPVCSPKCIRGKCVAPNKCKCNFSYVGVSCNVSCNCNGNSNCAGPDPVGLNRCLECKNNTVSLL